MLTRKSSRFWRILLAACLLIPFAGTVFPSVRVQAAQMTEDIAVSLVIDSSGSMADSDPERFSLEAANLFIDLLSPGDYLGVVRFSDKAEEVLPLQQVAAEGKTALKQELDNRFPAAGATDYVSALQLAAKQLEAAPFESEKIIIFLTDGFPEPMLAPGAASYDKAAYAQQVQAQVAALSQAGIPVYTVGFGTSDEALLEQIAHDTKGKAFLLSSPAEVASAFFGVLTDTKQRLTMDVTAASVSESGLLTIPIPAYTSQVTALVLTNGTKLEAALEGEQAQQAGIFLDVKSGYALLTVANPEQREPGEIPLKLKSDGQLQVVAARDVLFQPTLLAPENGAQYSFLEPLEIEVAFTEALADDMIVEAKVSKNGIPDLKPYILKVEAGIYSFTYAEVDEQGSYEVTVTVRNADGEIASRSAQFEVKDIPVVKSDTKWDGAVFKKGEETILTGYLVKQDMRMTEEQDLQIDHFQLLLIDSQKQEKSFALSDDPAEEKGDLVKDDGLYTLQYNFPEVGRYTAYLQAEGSYKGETFTLKQKIGSFEVGGRGALSISPEEESGWIDRNGNAHITVLAENQSKRAETIHIQVPAALGTVVEDEISLQPDSREQREILVALQGEEAPASLELTFQAADPLTVVNVGQVFSVPLRAGKTSLMQIMNQFVNRHQLLLLVVLAVMVTFVLGGYLLFYFQVTRKERLFSPLAYSKVDDLGSKQSLTIPKGKRSVRIVIGEGPSGDLFLPANQPAQGYHVLLLERTSILREIKVRFIAGYLALLPYYNQMRVTATALPPGYLKVNGSIASTVSLNTQETFEAAGYVFAYNRNNALEETNLLEGKDMYWQS